MISILPIQNNKLRTFGWVQDSGRLHSLCDVVAVFDENSEKHRELVNNIIPSLVSKQDGRDEMINLLNARPLKLPYTKLVGKGFTPRSESRCNGIIQAVVRGQRGRNFIGNWPADNYVRWAHCFGFIKYNYLEDDFEITETGLILTQAKKDRNILSVREKECLINAILAYPPAIRILKLLSGENVHLTKFELGKQLGFIGEDGFTSMPQKIYIQSLAEAKTAEEKINMINNWEGSSDKYARMIVGWLEELGFVQKIPKTITVCIAENEYTETVGQSYMITAAGISALHRSEGKSRHKRIPKNVCWEMLATKGSDKKYVRTRRAYILKYISEKRNNISADAVLKYLEAVDFQANIETIQDDINGLINMGLNITNSNGMYKFEDKINDFIIPLQQSLTKSDLNTLKEDMRTKLLNIPHEYLTLIDLAYDSKQNRLFEIKTLELLIEEMDYNGIHLGGSRKPDGIIYTDDQHINYGVIIDTKAYSKGYNLPIQQADEMERYIGENQTRNEKINPNKWWENFEENVGVFYFMFVSGKFKGNFEYQLKRISNNKGINGTAIAIATLLQIAEAYKTGKFTHEMIGNNVFINAEYKI